MWVAPPPLPPPNRPSVVRQGEQLSEEFHPRDADLNLYRHIKENRLILFMQEITSYFMKNWSKLSGPACVRPRISSGKPTPISVNKLVWCGLCLCMFCIYVVLCCFRHAEHEAVCWGCWTLPSSNATATSFIRPCFGSHCVNISWTAEDWATIRNEEGRGGGQREYIILFILEKEGECVSVNDCGPHVVPFMLGGNSIDGFVFLIPIPST